MHLIQSIAGFILCVVTTLCGVGLYRILIKKTKDENGQKEVRNIQIQAILLDKLYGTATYTMIGFLAISIIGELVTGETYQSWGKPSISLAGLLLAAMMLAATIIQKQKIKKAHKLQYKRSVAVLSGNDGNKLEVKLWVCRTQEEWPPLQLELSVDGVIAPCENLGENCRNIIDELLSNISESSDEELKRLKGSLTKGGAEHPIDIAHCDVSKTSRDFFAKILETTN